MLLFYFLLHRNKFVREFLLSRTDLDALLLPLLKHLYEVCSARGGFVARSRSHTHRKMTTTEITNSQQIYMMLIVLLMLSQQDEFGATCQRVVVAQVPWYKEQVVFDISLADVISLVLV